MCRQLINLLHELDCEQVIPDDKAVWLHERYDKLDEYCQRILNKMMPIAMQHLYVRPRCVNLDTVQLLHAIGYSVEAYPVRRLVIVSGKGRILIPSPECNPFQKYIIQVSPPAKTTLGAGQ